MYGDANWFKFYQSPPFCGALLVPKNITSKLVNITDKAVGSFLKIFSTSDIPLSHPKLRSKFRPNENYGTLLRWEAAVSEMKLLSFYGEDMVTMSVDRWNAFIISRLQIKSDYFELMQINNLPIDLSFLLTLNIKTEPYLLMKS